MKKIHLVDAGLGNIRSVSNAFEALDFEVVKCLTPQALEDAGAIVLPGVGAFGDGIDKLKKNGLDEAILKAVKRGVKLLGICLGMQFLFNKSHEFGEYQGLGLIAGEVKKMDVSGEGLRLPHIGWNDTFLVKDDPLFSGMADTAYFYYINSFSCVCENNDEVLAEYEYGKRFTAIVRKGNIVGVQFHPEKSQKDGLRLLKEFADLK